jgi:predicted small integral membrane protein
VANGFVCLVQSYMQYFAHFCYIKIIKLCEYNSSNESFHSCGMWIAGFSSIKNQNVWKKMKRRFGLVAAFTKLSVILWFYVDLQEEAV